MNDVQIFNNPDFGEIRTVIIDGEPWFVSKDISDKLGYAKPANMVKLVDEDDKRNLRGSDLEPGSKAQISAVNENAKKFKKWVTSEVLPSIRKTGSYTTPQLQSVSEIPLGELASYLKIMDRVANRQNLASYKIAENFKKVSEQFGVQLSEDFVNVPEYVQQTLKLEGGAYHG